ncbi:pre-mrna cleavage complex 2 protein pcf11-like isoform x2 [Nannochloropsis oceanica]
MGGMPEATTPLQRFQEDMGKLAAHPDKDTIMRLTNIAMTHQELGNDMVELVQSRVLSSKTPPAYRLPLCYLMDSILQNVRGQYISLFARYAVAMCCRTYEEGSVRDRQCIAKLLRLWRQRSIFHRSVLDPIDVHVERIEKAASAGADGGGGAGTGMGHAVGGIGSSSNGGGYGSGVGEKSPQPLPPPSHPPSSHIHYQGPPQAPVPTQSTTPAPAPSTAAPAASSSTRSLEFILAVDKEMREMLDGMVREMGEAKMTIEELARRNPQAAEQLKKVAEASVASRMYTRAQAAVEAFDAVGPFALPPTGREMWGKGGEVAQRLQKVIVGAGPNPEKPGLVNAARETAFQMLSMVNILMQQQGLPPLAIPAILAPRPPPRPVAPPPPPPPPPPPQQHTSQALAQQLAWALMQQQQQQQQQQRPPQQSQQQQQQQPPSVPHSQQQQQQLRQGQQLSHQQQAAQYTLSKLYTGEQCKEDGLRFPTPHALQAHQNRLQQTSSLATAAAGKGTTSTEVFLRSRPWFGLVSEWTKEPKPAQRTVALAGKIGHFQGGKGGGTGSGGARVDGAGGGAGEDSEHCVPMDDSGGGCMLCGEPFDQFWESGSSQWMYRNAIPVVVVKGECVPVSAEAAAAAGDGVLVHWLCFEASDRKEAAKMLKPRAQSPLPVKSKSNSSGGSQGSDLVEGSEEIELPDEVEA